MIYILQLKHNKYYIGNISNTKQQQNNYFLKSSNKWTQKYKPIKVLSLIKTYSVFDEDRYTLEYMSKYGINNVRGGSFCKIRLEHNEIKSIKKQLKDFDNICFDCGEKGHFSYNCPKKISFTKPYISTIFNTHLCNRCDREGHSKYECTQKTYDNGWLISDDEY